MVNGKYSFKYDIFILDYNNKRNKKKKNCVKNIRVNAWNIFNCDDIRSDVQNQLKNCVVLVMKKSAKIEREFVNKR